MVKLYALTVLYKGPTSATPLKKAFDVESFSYFQRGSVREFMGFVSKTIVERTQIAARQSVKEGGKVQHHIFFLVPVMTICFLVFYRVHVSCLCSR